MNGQAVGLTVREQEPGPALVEMNVHQAELQLNNAKMVFVIQVNFYFIQSKKDVIFPCALKSNFQGLSLILT